MDTVLSSSQAGVRVEAAALSAVNFALQQNGIAAIPSMTIYNDSDRELHNITLSIASGANLCLPYSKHFDTLPAKSSLNAGAAELVLDAQHLALLTESYADSLRLSLTREGETLWESNLPITVLAYDQWHGYASHPELLAAFVTPNHPALSPILSDAARLLGQWTDDPSLDGYQTRDPNRALSQAAAIYAAIQSRGIVYCVPPASFEESGQRVRLCDAVCDLGAKARHLPGYFPAVCRLPGSCGAASAADFEARPYFLRPLAGRAYLPGEHPRRCEPTYQAPCQRNQRDRRGRMQRYDFRQGHDL